MDNSISYTGVVFLESISKFLRPYLAFMQVIHSQFGGVCEGILYDLESEQHTVVAITGDITNPKLGSSVPEYIREILTTEGNNAQNRYGIINHSIGNMILRSSAIFIRDDKNIVGCFVLNYNMVQFKMIISFLNELSGFIVPDEEEIAQKQKVFVDKDKQDEKQYSVKNVTEFINVMMSDFIAEYIQNRDIQLLTREERKALIAKLDERGTFLVKGAVNIVAKYLQMSKFTIYAYLDEMRSDSDD